MTYRDASDDMEDLERDNERMMQTIVELEAELEKYRQMKCKNCRYTHINPTYGEYCSIWNELYSSIGTNSEDCGCWMFDPKETGK